METTPQIIQIEETASTSSYLKALLKERDLPECSVVITSNQTAGRGQPGNTWESLPGKNITFSIVLHPTMITASEQFILSKTVSVALTEVLEKIISPVYIKWPNDIYHKDRKLGGILIENALKGPVIDQCIAGIGINVNQPEFPDNLPNPVSLLQITGLEQNLPELFQNLFESLTDHYATLSEGFTQTIEEKYLARLYRSSGRYRYKDANGEFMARFSGIGPAGHLFLLRDNGEISSYAFKEVEYVL
ncbi:MAG: biotin--[acetyl-CoA-carboxylase] ligase [Marinilabilia sp.]